MDIIDTVLALIALSGVIAWAWFWASQTSSWPWSFSWSLVRWWWWPFETSLAP